MVERDCFNYFTINHWSKGLVEEKDHIPNYERNYDCSYKTLTVVEPVDATKTVKFEKPAPKSAVQID
jgi:hypothetical protein